MRSCLETNGILDRHLAEIIDDADIIAMDFKLPSSTKCRPYWEEHEAFLRIARQKEVFIKVVISSDTDKEDIARSVELVAGSTRTSFLSCSQIISNGKTAPWTAVWIIRIIAGNISPTSK